MLEDDSTQQTPSDFRTPEEGLDHAIAVQGLVRQQGRFSLGPLDLTLPTGYIAGFVGRNGAGKTTTLKTLLGLQPADAGSVRLLGGAADDPEVKQRIGVVLDVNPFVPEWRVDGFGRRYGRLWRSWDDAAYRDLLERFGIPLRARAGTLSKGQSVKLALAVALAHHPDLLILDEPSSGLDPVGRADLADVLRAFCLDPSHSVLFSTHITSELDGLADHLHLIDDGRIRWSGELDRLHEQYAVARGAGAPPGPARDRMIGLRVEHERWQALIDVEDTAAFSPDVVIDPASTDDVIVHLTHRPGLEVVSA